MNAAWFARPSQLCGPTSIMYRISVAHMVLTITVVVAIVIIIDTSNCPRSSPDFVETNGVVIRDCFFTAWFYN